MANETEQAPTPEAPATPVPPVLRPGYKTTEFWMSMAATLVSSLVASGVIPTTESWQKAVAIVAAVFSAFGYTIVRTNAKKAAMSIGLIFVAMSVSACCYNKNSPDYSTPKCIVARGTVDCTVGALKDQAGRGVALVMQLISNGTFDVPTLIEALKNIGIKDGECILAVVADEFITKPSAAPDTNASKFLYSWSDWRVQHRPGVKYALPGKPANRN